VEETLAHIAPSNGRTRRRLIAWAIFGATGVLLGSVWAFGFSTSSGTVGTANTTAALVAGTAGSTSTSPYAGTITNPEDLAVTWDGNWGVLAADTTMFKVDLLAYPNTQTFFVEVYSRGVPTGWTTLQLKFANLTQDDGLACDATDDFTGAASTQVMPVTNSDAQVTFSGLAGGKVYCVGIDSATPRADDITGTFLRRPGDAAPDVPSFTAMVNRSA
jgi:hypothetical protein